MKTLLTIIGVLGVLLWLVFWRLGKERDNPASGQDIPLGILSILFTLAEVVCVAAYCLLVIWNHRFW